MAAYKQLAQGIRLSGCKIVQATAGLTPLLLLVPLPSEEPQANAKDNEADEYPKLYQHIHHVSVFGTVGVHLLSSCYRLWSRRFSGTL